MMKVLFLALRCPPLVVHVALQNTPAFIILEDLDPLAS